MLATLCARTALLGEDRVVREGLVEHPDNCLFRFPVGLGNEIDGVGLAGDPNVA